MNKLNAFEAGLDIFRPRTPVAQAIYDRLCEEHGRRARNPNWIDDEIIALWEVTNRQRAMLGKGPVSLDAVRNKERMAMGHIDYASKCAYYCAELVNSHP